jgi:hypothetical protein
VSDLHARAFGNRVGQVTPWASRLGQHSLTWIGAFDSETLIGFVHACWDGGLHAFLSTRSSTRRTSAAASAKPWCRL